MHKNNLELRDVTCVASSKKLSRCRSFHFRYLELCRSKNITPLTEIKAKNNCTSVLDFFGDKLTVTDWLLLLEALYNDQVLQTLGIRTRKPFGTVLEHLDTEKKARLFRQKPVLYTKFIFAGVVESISNCIEFNKTLRVLHLCGLPLNDKYVESIAKALSSNKSLQEISFARSSIGDKGCEAICNTVKYLENIEQLNLSECGLTTKGAECIADMIKVLKISRYTVGWQKSLRYRNVDPESIPGLRSISIAHNPTIGDDGIKDIVEVLKEDAWIKVIDMENCGLTDRAANMILDCLELNNYIIDFNVRGNSGISKFLQRSIRDQLGKEDEDQKLLGQEQEIVQGPNGTLVRRPKVTMASLKEHIKALEEQLAHERVLRKKAEHLSEKLNQQIVAYENQLETEMKSNIPEGYVVVKNESLQSIIRERNDFQKLANSVIVSNETTPRNNIVRARQPTDHSLLSTDDMESSNVPHNSPIPSDQTSVTQIEQRKALKVRKVKSEVKYVEAPTKDADKRPISKSDHEFYNESDSAQSAIQFESHIGDSVDISSFRSSNTVINTKAAHLMISKEKNVNLIYNNNIENKCNANENRNNINNNSSSSSSNNNNNNNINNNNNNNNNNNSNNNHYINLNKFDLDDISMPTARSSNSDVFSSDSDTIRNEMMDSNFQPMKVFIRRGKASMPLTPMPKSPTDEHLEIIEKSQQQSKGDGGNHNVSYHAKTPRSLFLGLCED